jgi:hypothetical protein
MFKVKSFLIAVKKKIAKNHVLWHIILRGAIIWQDNIFIGDAEIPFMWNKELVSCLHCNSLVFQ